MSFNDCLSQDDQNELLAIRDGIDTLQWEVGDIANRNYQKVRDQYAFMYVCAAVGYYCGKSTTTITRWAKAAAFYSKDMRKKYHGLLTMEHFISAMAFPDWEQRLERAAYGGYNEQPMSVAQMNQESYVEPSAPPNYPVSPTAVVSFEINEPTVQVTGPVENTIQTILGLIDRLAHALHLDDVRQRKVYQAMQLLSEALSENQSIHV